MKRKTIDRPPQSALLDKVGPPKKTERPGLSQLTNFRPRGENIPTQWGMLSYHEWCEYEACRLGLAFPAYRYEVVCDGGSCAIFCGPRGPEDGV